MHPIAAQDNRPAGNDPRPDGRRALRMTSGRRAALAFGVPVCLALVAVTGLSFAADLGTASFPVRYAFPASATRIAVSTGGGQLTLAQTSTQHAATLTGTAQYSLIRPDLPSGGLASYDYRCRVPFGNCGLTATVTIPTGMAAAISTAGGNITADNASGSLTLDTDGGDILANAIRSARVTASSGGGNITIYFSAIPRDVNVSTAGGDITIVVPYDPGQYYDVITHTDGGSTSVAVHRDSSSRNVINATSGGGNITVREAAP